MLRLLLGSFLTCIWLGQAAAADQTLVGEDGLHKQIWYLQSTGDLRRDLHKANTDGKTLMLVIEQLGCAYCVEMHARNFQRAEIVDVIKASFVVVQLDLRGDDPVVDFDGQITTEASMMRKWGVFTTPTTIVLRNDAAVGLSLQDAQAFRLPGYLKPFEHLAVLDYFATGAFKTEELRPYMRAKLDALVSQGFDPANW